VPTPEQIRGFLDLGPFGLLAVAVIALVLEIVVSGRAYKRLLAERDMAYERLDRITAILEGGAKAPK